MSQIFCDFEERDVVFLKRLKGFCFSQHVEFFLPVFEDLRRCDCYFGLFK